MLEGIEIYAVDTIVTRRSVEIDSQEILGADEAGSVVFDNGMKIYVPACDLDENGLDVHEFAEKMLAFCKIATDFLPVVFTVLHPASGIRYIEKALERRGINFEKRDWRVNPGKVVDDSAGIVLPSRPVVAKQDASGVRQDPTMVPAKGIQPTRLRLEVPNNAPSTSYEAHTAMSKQPSSAPRQHTSHMTGSVPLIKHQPSLEYCDTETEDSTETSADSEIYQMKPRHGINVAESQKCPPPDNRKAFIRGRSSHNGITHDALLRGSRPAYHISRERSPSSGSTPDSRPVSSVLDDQLNKVTSRSGPSGGSGPFRRLPGHNNLKSSSAILSTSQGNGGQLDAREDHHVIRIGEQGELKVRKNAVLDHHKLTQDSSMSFSEAFSDLAVRPKRGPAKRALHTPIQCSKKMKACSRTLPLLIPKICLPLGWLNKAMSSRNFGFRPSISQLSTVWR